MTNLRTKVTRLNTGYGCRILEGDVVIVEALAPSRNLIGATFRDLLRTLDKCGGDDFTKAARVRKYKEGNAVVSVKHMWGGK